MPAHRPAAEPAALREVVSGRHADVPPVLRARGLRLGCDAHQRRQPAGVQGADARSAAQETRQAADHHHRADPRAAGGEGPRRRHGAVLRRVPCGQAVPDHQRQSPDAGTDSEPDRPRALRRHHQVHPVRVLHHQLPHLLERGQLFRARRDRQRPPVHLRQPRRGRRRAPRHPQRGGRGVALPHHVQLHRIVPARHPGDAGDPGGQARADVRALDARLAARDMRSPPVCAPFQTAICHTSAGCLV